MSEHSPQEPVQLSESEIVASRRAKLKRFRDELGFEPYGQREDGLLPLSDARARFSEEAHVAYEAAAKEAKTSGGTAADSRARVRQPARAPTGVARRVAASQNSCDRAQISDSTPGTLTH